MAKGLRVPPAAFPYLNEMIADHRRKPRLGADRPPSPPWSPRPPIYVMLLEDLPTGGEALGLILHTQETGEVQLVTLRGEVTGGDFVLSWDGTTWTPPIPWDATAEEMQAAIEDLPQINPGDVAVMLGEVTLTEVVYKPGRWAIKFTGQYEGVDVPLLKVDYNGRDGVGSAGGVNSAGLDSVPNFAAWMQVKTTERWEWDGESTETVRNGIPVGEPTPLQKKAICRCSHVPGFGYDVDKFEALDFSVLDSDAEY